MAMYLTDGINTVLPYEQPYDESAYTQYAHVSSKAKKEGWLTKQGGLVRNWKKRWYQSAQIKVTTRFVLTDGALYYYAEKNPEEYPKGWIPLARGITKIYESPNAVPDRPFYFEINPDPDYPSTRVYCLDASSAEERKSWIRALRDITGTN